MSFRDRYGPWALVAGASDGIGEAFARRIAERGVNVLLLARREALLARLAGEIRAEHGVEARPLVADLTAPDLDARVEAATRGLEVGLLVYNAGAVHGVGAFHERPLEHAQQLVALNCTGPVLLAHRLGGPMRARGRGGIVLVTSMVALSGSAHVAAYAASKSFDWILAQSLWHELRPHGVDALAAVVGMTQDAEPARLGADVPGGHPADGARRGGAGRARLPRPRAGLVRRPGEPRSGEGTRRDAAAGADRHDEPADGEPLRHPTRGGPR